MAIVLPVRDKQEAVKLLTAIYELDRSATWNKQHTIVNGSLVTAQYLYFDNKVKITSGYFTEGTIRLACGIVE